MPQEGPRSPGAGTNDSTVGIIAWADPGNILASDNARATAVQAGGNAAQTNYCRASQFGFSVIPAGSTIVGILVEVERSRVDAAQDPGCPTPNVVDASIRLRGPTGYVGSNKSTGAQWPTTEAYASFGGPTDTWNAGLSRDDVASTAFGVGVSCTITGSTVASKEGGPCSATTVTTARIDHIRITVYYTSSSGGGMHAASQVFSVAAGIMLPVMVQRC